jgi:hypothetical protein
LVLELPVSRNEEEVLALVVEAENESAGLLHWQRERVGGQFAENFIQQFL